MTNTLILIPARMASTRLPDKPMAEINGLPMICQVIDRAREANIGEPVVATDSQIIIDAVEAHGAKAVMTRKDHESGSDRIWEAVEKIDPKGEADTIINLQGDLPAIDPNLIRQSVLPLEDETVDIATLAAEIKDEAEKTNPNVVKAIGTRVLEQREKLEQLRALENGMRIDIELVQTIPHGVDTAEDLEKAKQLLERL